MLSDAHSPRSAALSSQRGDIATKPLSASGTGQREAGNAGKLLDDLERRAVLYREVHPVVTFHEAVVTVPCPQTDTARDLRAGKPVFR